MRKSPSCQSMQHGFLHEDDAAKDPQPSDSMAPHFNTEPDRKPTPTPTPSADSSKQRSHSPPLHQTSTQVSQSTFLISNGADLTPPSSSRFCSQEHDSFLTSDSPVKQQPHLEQCLTVPSDTCSDTISLTTASPTREESPDLIPGQKRTASGQVKKSSITGIQDLKHGDGPTRHSRTSSILSDGSSGKIVDLSQQLRTRLSYAMVKVQNGWQSHTLEEVESLASSQASPKSPISGFPNAAKRRSWQSPRASMTASLQRKSSSGESSEGTTAACSATQARQWPEAHDLSQQSSHQPVMARRGLAPPADITCSTPRRPTSNTATTNSHVNAPYTPTRHHSTKAYTPKQRTPSQNAAMEADAVETLLFMASPGNSGYHPTTTLRSTAPTSLQTSPVRSQFHLTAAPTLPRRRVSFADHASNNKRSHGEVSKAKDIEAMLDESDDDSSDALDEALGLARRHDALRTTRF